MQLHLESETIGRTGGITGAGARKVLGAPHIDSLEIVIREAIQNSWDAAAEPRIRFGIEGYEFNEKQAKALRDALSAGAKGHDPVVPLPDKGLDALLLWDRGTSGLGGSTRPDEADDGDRDFVRFVYMIGDTKVQTDAFDAKGGTYGFGRSSFITASSVGTILVHTRCEYQGKRQSRFIGMTWTDPERGAERRITGRHWWGEQDGKHAIPLTGPAADQLATSLGMNPHGDTALGTSILILQPRWPGGENDLKVLRETALDEIQSGLLWNCWPRLMDSSIQVPFRWFGTDIQLPSPESYPGLSLFTRAYKAATSKSVPGNSTREIIQCLKPAKDLGLLALTQAPFAQGEQPNSDADDGQVLNDRTKALHHVALMRGTRLVIRYLEGPVPRDGLQYAGVFIADKGVDSVFAASEPPTHDDWVKNRLQGTERRYVSVAMKRIPEAAARFCRPPPDASAEGSSDDLGLLADQLGGLLHGVEGDGASPGKGGRGGAEGGGGRRGSKVNVAVGAPERLAHTAGVELRFPILLTSRGSDSVKVSLSAVAKVALEGGSETTPPIGAREPQVLGWMLSRDGALAPGTALELIVQREARCYLAVAQPTDCSLRLSVNVE